MKCHKVTPESENRSVTAVTSNVMPATEKGKEHASLQEGMMGRLPAFVALGSREAKVQVDARPRPQHRGPLLGHRPRPLLSPLFHPSVRPVRPGVQL